MSNEPTLSHSALEEDVEAMGALRRDEFGDFFEADSDGGPIEVALDDADWGELYESGVDYIEAARIVFDDLADASDDEVEIALADMIAGMSEAETAEFFKKLARAAVRGLKKVRRIAGPVLKVAAPLVGTTFGGPLGGVVGGLLGKVGSRAMRGRRRVRRRYRSRRRPVRRSRVSSSIARLLRLIRNPSVQRTLARALRGESLVSASGESMSAPAVMIGLHGAIVESLQEMQEMGMDLDHAVEGYGPDDFSSAQEACDALESLLESDFVAEGAH